MRYKGAIRADEKQGPAWLHGLIPESGVRILAKHHQIFAAVFAFLGFQCRLFDKGYNAG